MDHKGKIQVGGQESGNAWANATCQLSPEEIVVVVNGAEVLRQRREQIDFEPTENDQVFKVPVEGEPVFFYPDNLAAFKVDLAGDTLTAAQRVELAQSQPGPTGHQPQPAVPAVKNESKPLYRRTGFILVVAIAVLLILANLGGGGSSNAPISNNNNTSAGHEPVEAYVVCQQFVEDRLKAPSTADFGGPFSQVTTHNGNGNYTVRTYVDAQNSFGAMIRTNFTCVVDHVSGDRYSLVSLDMDEN